MNEGKQYLLYTPFPILETVKDLSAASHLSPGLLFKLSTRNNLYYRVFSIPKSSGDSRTIAEPARPMKAVQSWILTNILRELHLPPQVTGFRHDCNILKNARSHERNKYLLSLDIEDFFPSIKYSFVYTVFRSLGYNKHICHVLTSLCTFNGSLPQGGVTSPALSNLVCIRMDRRISGYCGARNIAYTRYADDMTFSSMNANRLVGLYTSVQTIVESEGFKLNNAKTRYMGPKRRQKVTGLVIGDGKAGIGRQAERKIRAEVYITCTKPNSGDEERVIKRLRGYLCFVKSVDSERYNRLASYIDRICTVHNRTDLRQGLICC